MSFLPLVSQLRVSPTSEDIKPHSHCFFSLWGKPCTVIILIVLLLLRVISVCFHDTGGVIVLSMLPLLREQNDNKARTESAELSELREHNLW